MLELRLPGEPLQRFIFLSVVLYLSTASVVSSQAFAEVCSIELGEQLVCPGTTWAPAGSSLVARRDVCSGNRTVDCQESTKKRASYNTICKYGPQFMPCSLFESNGTLLLPDSVRKCGESTCVDMCKVAQQNPDQEISMESFDICRHCPEGERDAQLHHVCESSKHSNVSGCPTGWFKLDNFHEPIGKCYHRSPAGSLVYRQTWDEAHVECAGYEGVMASVDAVREWEQLVDLNAVPPGDRASAAYWLDAKFTVSVNASTGQRSIDTFTGTDIDWTAIQTVQTGVTDSCLNETRPVMAIGKLAASDEMCIVMTFQHRCAFWKPTLCANQRLVMCEKDAVEPTTPPPAAEIMTPALEPSTVIPDFLSTDTILPSTSINLLSTASVGFDSSDFLRSSETYTQILSSDLLDFSSIDLTYSFLDSSQMSSDLMTSVSMLSSQMPASSDMDFSSIISESVSMMSSIASESTMMTSEFPFSTDKVMSSVSINTVEMMSSVEPSTELYSPTAVVQSSTFYSQPSHIFSSTEALLVSTVASKSLPAASSTSQLPSPSSSAAIPFEATTPTPTPTPPTTTNATSLTGTVPPTFPGPPPLPRTTPTVPPTVLIHTDTSSTGSDMSPTTTPFALPPRTARPGTMMPRTTTPAASVAPGTKQPRGPHLYPNGYPTDRVNSTVTTPHGGTYSSSPGTVSAEDASLARFNKIAIAVMVSVAVIVIVAVIFAVGIYVKATRKPTKPPIVLDDDIITNHSAGTEDTQMTQFSADNVAANSAIII